MTGGRRSGTTGPSPLSLGSRGQVYTLQGVIGSILVVSALVLGMQAVDIAPWANDPVEPELENRRVLVQDIFDAAQDRDSLRTAVTCVSDTDTGNPAPSAVSPSAPGTGFATLLGQQLEPATDNFIVELRYRNGTDDRRVVRLHPPGDPQPRDGAVSVSTQFALYDSDTLYEENGGECVATDQTIGENDDYYVEEGDGLGAGTIYNTVRLRVIAW